MSRQPAKSSSTKTKKQRASVSRSTSRGSESKGRNAKAQKLAGDSRLLDEKARRDILGVAICVVAIVLFVAAILPSNAVLSSFISTALHLTLGIGAYILPVLLFAIGLSFHFGKGERNVPTRVALGLALIFVAFLGLLAVFAPGAASGSTVRLFARDVLEALGGYIGSGIAWAGITLFGQIISCIILLGIMVAGVIVTGFSLSALYEKVLGKSRLQEQDRDSMASAPYARVSRRVPPADESLTTSSATTSLLAVKHDDSGKTRKMKSDTARKKRVSQDAEKTRLLPALDATNEQEMKDEKPRQMTRKLGAKHRDDAAEQTQETKPKSSRNATPVAAPHPQDGFELPSMELLATTKGKAKDAATETELRETAANLQETLEDFGIMAEVVGWVAGPTVTLFKVDLPAGVRVSRVTALNDDIALALAAPGVRIFAPIPGTNYVGIEVPNQTRQTVLLGDVLKSAAEGPLQIAIGKDVEGNAIITDLAKMPHLLIGGTTGSGKSVSINAMIMSILMRATPAEVRFIMIDPKRVEFTPYNGIPHLYVPVVTEPKEAASALSWGVAEMERRLKVFSKVGARNIGQYNAKVQNGELEDQGAGELPYIVIIIDELADLMMNVGKEVEFSISRIAQLARAAGIHLIVATQRPSTNVVTGLIKANITNRIAFNVASGIDSRVVLDTPGAENLIGLGDLLFSKPEFAKPQRIQGCYVSEDEINAVVDMLKNQGEPEYHDEILKTNLITLGASSPDGSGSASSDDDPLIWEAAEIVVSSGLGSTSNIQRRLKVGYSRAGRIMDMLEEKGIVGPPNGSKPRDVLVDEMELETLKAFEQNDAAGDGL